MMVQEEGTGSYGPDSMKRTTGGGWVANVCDLWARREEGGSQRTQ